MDGKSTDKRAPAPEGADDARREPHGAGRRRFLLGGAAAPVILTLASRPALAANCEPCGFMELSASASASAAARVEACGGANTEYWKYDVAAWDTTGYDPGSLTRLRGRDRLDFMLRQLDQGAGVSGEGGAFGDAFSEDVPGGSAVATVDETGRPIPRWRGGTKFHHVFPGAEFGTKSLMQVLWGHPESLGAYASAALLNASDQGARKYPLPATQVIDIYYQISSYGYYQTANDFKMDRQKAIDFFRNTFS